MSEEQTLQPSSQQTVPPPLPCVTGSSMPVDTARMTSTPSLTRERFSAAAIIGATMGAVMGLLLGIIILAINDPVDRQYEFRSTTYPHCERATSNGLGLAPVGRAGLYRAMASCGYGCGSKHSVVCAGTASLRQIPGVRKRAALAHSSHRARRMGAIRRLPGQPSLYVVVRHKRRRVYVFTKT